MPDQLCPTVAAIQLDAVCEETGTGRPISRRVHLKGHRFFRWVRLPSWRRLECGIWATEPDRSLAP
ncbi:MAG: hypothetical protein OXC82_05170 [Rhodobacteraceae bacterium]|nr:hypothetical protein [Paracoccaceae bacterium]